MKFFVSYSRSVQDKVREIIASLRDEGDEVWWDQDLRAGQDWWGMILNTIEWCDVCLFMVSEKSVQSPYCMDELRYALARNRLVLPYVMDGPVSYTIPPEIMKGRIQYETYAGVPGQLRQSIKITCQRVDWGQYKDRYASRPPEPNTGSNDLVDRLDKAIALAQEGLFDEAIAGFNDVAPNDFRSYGDFCHQWIEKINRYKEVASLANRPTMKKLALPRWEEFLRQYADDDAFDPLGVGEKLGHTAVDRGPSAQFYANRAYQRPDHDYDLKIADYSEAIRLKPDYVDAYVNRGLSYSDKDDHDRAIADYSEAIRLNPLAATAYVNRAVSYAEQGRHDRAIADCTEAIRLNPQDADAYNNRGASYEAKRDYDRAIADYTEALRLNPQDADAYNNRGVSHEAKGEYDRALEDYEAALRLDPQHTLARQNRQIALDIKQRSAAALSDNSTPAQSLTADQYFQRGRKRSLDDYKGKVDDYTEAIRLKPNFPEAYSRRGRNHDLQGIYDLGMADHNEAIRLKPDYAYAYNNRGLSYFAQKDFDRAIKDFNEAIRLKPRYADAYSNRGLSYYAKKDFDRAITDYNAALGIDPDHALAKEFLLDAIYAKRKQGR